MLEADDGLRLVPFKQMVQAVQRSTSMAKALSVSTELPLLFIERIGHSENEMPFEVLRALFRSDRYALHSEFER